MRRCWDWDLATDRLVWDAGTGPLLDYDRGLSWANRPHGGTSGSILPTASVWSPSIDAAISRGRRGLDRRVPLPPRRTARYAVVQDRAHIARDETGSAQLRVVSAMSGLSNAQRADRQLQQVLDALQVGVSVIDKQGRIVVANSSEPPAVGWWP